MTYIEVDFDEIVTKKIHEIKKHQELLSLINVCEDDDSKCIIEDFSINSPHYKLLSQDLRNIEEFHEKLNSMNVDTNLPTLIITECLLIYMRAEESLGILKGLTTLFTGDLVFVNYEMINPNDPFGKVMIENIQVSFNFTFIFHHNFQNRIEDAIYWVFMIVQILMLRNRG
jgi:[phosphatase 2A protein]-leucine-carboxy methyltransferase